MHPGTYDYIYLWKTQAHKKFLAEFQKINHFWRWMRVNFHAEDKFICIAYIVIYFFPVAHVYQFAELLSVQVLAGD